MYDNRTLSCRDCADSFVFSAGEPEFFASKGLENVPQRCPTCRSAARKARDSGGPRAFHVATCAGCGGQALEPFSPSADKPVYCSACFEQVRLIRAPAAAPTA